jgi:6,7-dimethyl-8-ribityllumazine synthase
MSTLTSADFGELKRPTTRIHAPPGGGSNWSIGGDDVPTRTPQRHQRGAMQHSPPKPQAPVVPIQAVAPAPPAPVAVPVTFASPQAAVPTGIVRIAVLKTKADAEIVDTMAQNCMEKLKSFVATEVFTVSTVDELPYAANKLTQVGGFDGVVAFGFLNATDPLYQSLSTCLTQSFIDISVKNVKPVVRGLFFGEPRTAAVKAKSGWGAEFADNLRLLVDLGNNHANDISMDVSMEDSTTVVQAPEQNFHEAKKIAATPMQQQPFQPRFSNKKQHGAGESSIVFG